MTSADTLTEKCRKLKLYTYIIAHTPADINVKLSCPDLTVYFHVSLAIVLAWLRLAVKERKKKYALLV